MVRFLYFLLIVFLVRLVLQQFALWLGGRAPRQMRDARSSHSTTVYRGVMVRDSVCGLHLPEARAIVEHRAGESLFFCSERCRDTFQRAS